MMCLKSNPPSLFNIAVLVWYRLRPMDLNKKIKIIRCTHATVVVVDHTSQTDRKIQAWRKSSFTQNYVAYQTRKNSGSHFRRDLISLRGLLSMTRLLKPDIRWKNNPRPGRPGEVTIERFENLILENVRLKKKQHAEMIITYNYFDNPARPSWHVKGLRQMATKGAHTASKTAASWMLPRALVRTDILDWIVTGYEPWIHHYESQSK